MIRVNLVSIEDGLDNVGFRKVSAYIKKIHENTHFYCVTIGNMRSILRSLMAAGPPSLHSEDIEAIAAGIADAGIIGFSSMTQYASLTAQVIAAIRRRNPNVYILWGGIHPIVDPEDAIKHASAICTGEGEFAFERFFTAFKEKQPFTGTPGFWFNSPDGIIKNRNLPLMTSEEMDRLPMLTYKSGEQIYKRGIGFVPISDADFITSSGLGYHTVWSIGCPFKCTYCANSVFIDADAEYRKIRHSSPAKIIAEIKEVIRKQPYISTITFHDDSFLALQLSTLEEFSRLYKEEIDLPFAMTGVIPNYVSEKKLAVLISAGMIRLRMGIQSGSQGILDFYERLTPVKRIRESCISINKFSSYIIPPVFDIILDNPVEKLEDTIATLDLLYQMPRPYNLNIYGLRVIPNTKLAMDVLARGVKIPDIRNNYERHVPTLANLLIYVIVVFKLPRWVYDRLRKKVLPSTMPQKLYPKLTLFFRLLYLARRVVHHLRFMDFSVIPGRLGYILWKIGLVRWWHKHMLPKYTGMPE